MKVYMIQIIWNINESNFNIENDQILETFIYGSNILNLKITKKN